MKVTCLLDRECEMPGSFANGNMVKVTVKLRKPCSRDTQ